MGGIFSKFLPDSGIFPTLFVGNSTNISEEELSFIADNVGPDLQPLGRSLNLTQTELAEFDEAHGRLREKIRNAIVWWIQREGRNATKAAMIEALRSIRRNDIADMLIALPGLPKEQEKLTDFAKLQQRLMRVYSHISIPQPPRIKKDLPIDKIFIDQEMERYGDDQIEDEDKILQLEDLLKSGSDKPVKRVLVEGDPGFGKTTLVTKLATDWAKGREYISSKFHLVILIPMGEVREERLEDVIINLIRRATKKSTLQTAELEKFLSENKVLLLLDGYDEMPPESQNRIRPILTMDEMETVSVLVTSRRGFFTVRESLEHSISSILLKDEGYVECDSWDTRVLLKGLSSKQRKVLLQDNFEINPEILETKLKDLFIGTADEMFRCPLLVFWLGWMAEKEPIQEIKTRTTFLKALINLILHKTLVRTKKITEKETIDIFTEPTDERTACIQEEICQFGRLALERLISRNFLFTEADVKSLSGSILLVSDILVKYKSLTRKEEEIYFQPMHRTFLEFLASFSLCRFINQADEASAFNEFKGTVDDIVRKGVVPSLNSMFFPFVAGSLDDKAHWLFQALLPWSAIFQACKPEMINILLEITNCNKHLIELLLKFVPSYYKIVCFKGIPETYYFSDFHLALLVAGIQRNSISILDCDASILHRLAVVSRSSFETLYVRISNLKSFNVLDVDQTTNATEPFIQCNNIIYIFNGVLNPAHWQFYKPFLRTVKAEHYHLAIEQTDISTLTMVLNDIKDGEWSHISFQRVRLSSCVFVEGCLDTLAQLVKEHRIQKGIRISFVKKSDNVTDAMNRLWEAIFQSPFIDEFCYDNTTKQLVPTFNFKLLSNDRKKFPIQMMHIIGRFYVINENLDSSGQSVHELTLQSLDAKDEDVAHILMDVRNVKYLECNKELFTLCASKKFSFLTSLNELYLPINVDYSFSVMELIPCLQALILRVKDFSSSVVPSDLESFLGNILISQNVRYLGFHFIDSTDITSVMKLCYQVTSRNTVNDLQCLQLIFEGEWTRELPRSAFNPVKNLMVQKKLKHLAIVSRFNFAHIRYLLPYLFSEEYFQFTYDINECQKHSVWFRQCFERFLITRDIFYVSLKNGIAAT